MKKDEFKQRIEEIMSADYYEELIDKFYTDVFEQKKICSKCSLILPADKKHFGPHPHTRDGLQSQCRTCQTRANEASAAKRAEKERIETGHQIVEQVAEQWTDYEEEYTESGEEIEDYKEEFVDYQEDA